ncbi:MAG TPA: radical SAM protein [Methanoculleus sp.]|nr:radical SAM protein [Methanoculleus sp.]
MQELSEGCILCHQGAKMVLFLTGICPRNCWYCPISAERRGGDAAYANDRRIVSDADLIEEGRIMSALGTGITGGEPLIAMEALIHYCSLLKSEFGKEHHIHLYTGKAPSLEELRRLQGLVDEIRLHPPHECWPEILQSPYIPAIRAARDLGFAVGIEVPSLPGLEALIPVVPLLDFLNINELEWSETNANAMRSRGYDLEDCHHNAVGGARAWAEELLVHARVHWCSSVFKDSVQLRERLKRIARNTARTFDEITEDGTVVYGVWEHSGQAIPFDHDLYEAVGDQLHMAWWVLAEHAKHLPGTKYVVERYPNGGIVVEVTPL